MTWSYTVNILSAMYNFLKYLANDNIFKISVLLKRTVGNALLLHPPEGELFVNKINTHCMREPFLWLCHFHFSAARSGDTCLFPLGISKATTVEGKVTVLWSSSRPEYWRCSGLFSWIKSNSRKQNFPVLSLALPWVFCVIPNKLPSLGVP